jgi:hypothetical protein
MEHFNKNNMNNSNQKKDNGKTKTPVLSTKQTFGKMVEDIKMENSLLRGQLNYINGKK